MAAKVSVIIPTFNRSSLLKRALESVYAQTFEDWEVWVADDHSNEDLSVVVEESSLEQVRLVKNQGHGVSAARNAAIRQSSSPLLAFLDSDDEWAPSKLAQQVEFLEKNPKISLVHTEEIWLRSGTPISQLKKHRKSGGRIFERCTDLCVISPSSTMVRRPLLERVGLFDEDFVVCEDFDLWLRISAEEEVGFLPEALTIKHGGHEDQLSRKYHSMDLWRVRALKKHLNSTHLSSNEHRILRENLRIKAEILRKGLLKHQNLQHLKEVDAVLEALN